jgi:hypothetical protein
MSRNHPIQNSEQKILNKAFEQSKQAIAVAGVETDGTNELYKVSSLTAKKITTSGDFTYIATAPIGTAQATAGWQVKRIETSGSDTIITWADGDAEFNNVATDLTALSYS